MKDKELYERLLGLTEVSVENVAIDIDKGEVEVRVSFRESRFGAAKMAVACMCIA